MLSWNRKSKAQVTQKFHRVAISDGFPSCAWKNVAFIREFLNITSTFLRTFIWPFRTSFDQFKNGIDIFSNIKHKISHGSWIVFCTQKKWRKTIFSILKMKLFVQIEKQRKIRRIDKVCDLNFWWAVLEKNNQEEIVEDHTEETILWMTHTLQINGLDQEIKRSLNFMTISASVLKNCFMKFFRNWYGLSRLFHKPRYDKILPF
jgi:hypothetical protein